jgi:glycosyltransferase involved in cell wall biosynthesis
MPADVLILSRYTPLGASSRVRTYQYLEHLRAAGVTFDVRPMFDDAYVAARNSEDGAPPLVNVIRAYIGRLRSMLAASSACAVWIEYELLPWLPFGLEQWFYKSNRPVIVDYDDAIFHRYDSHRRVAIRGLLGDKIDRIMAASTAVVAGNEYLAEHARLAGARHVEILPSVIDLTRYRQRTRTSSEEFVLGWIGSRSTTSHLRMLEPVLRNMATELHLRVVNVGGARWVVPGVRIDNRTWSEESEIDRMLEFDVGVMPLPDEPWTRGKCGFKLVQYMGCALPTIASPMGANVGIVDHGVTGLLASSAADWENSLRTLAQSPDLRLEMGRKGFEKAARQYSLAVTAPKLVDLVQSVLRQGRR